MKTRGLACAVGFLLVAPACALDITACYQTVPAGEVGTLAADLNCDGSGGPEVNVDAGAALQLNGHTITGGHIGVASYPGGQRATIEGPGQVTGLTGNAPPYGCAISVQGRALIRNVTLSGNDCGIDAVYNFGLTLEDVQITNNTGDGVTFIPPGPGGGRVKAARTTITNNGGTGIVGALRVIGQEITVTGNAAGGVLGPAGVTLVDSTITGNGPAGDIQSAHPPRLRNTTCDHSRNTTSGTPFGVCTLD